MEDRRYELRQVRSKRRRLVLALRAGSLSLVEANKRYKAVLVFHDIEVEDMAAIAPWEAGSAGAQVSSVAMQVEHDLQVSEIVAGGLQASAGQLLDWQAQQLKGVSTARQELWRGVDESMLGNVMRGLG